MTEQKPGAPWWQTLPGVLTATGTLIVAVTGLLGMLHQSGLLGGGSTAGKQPATAEASAAAPSAAQPRPAAPADSDEETDRLDTAEKRPTTPSTANGEPAVTAGLTAAAQQAEFRRRVQQGLYPSEVEGQCKEGVETFRTLWKPLPAGAEFVSVRSMSKEGFQTKRDKFAGDGYAIESVHSYQNCKGVERYHATWIKR